MQGLQYIYNDIMQQLNGLDVTTVNAAWRLLLSLLLGALVGTERKRKGQIAGVRTFSLISMGACLAMLLSIYVPQEYLGLKNGDPGRIAAQVITGIGFLGGGAMIQMRGSVRGLTTAAGIWLTAIIGMAVGFGMYIIAVIATILGLLVLVAFEWYEKWSRVGQASKAINIKVHTIITDLQPYTEVFDAYDVHLSTYYLDYNYDNETTEVNFVVLVKPHADMLPLLEALSRVYSTRELTLSSQIEI